MVISTFSSPYEAYVDTYADLPWEQIVELLLGHINVTKKEDGYMYNLAEFKKITDVGVLPGRKYHYINGEKQESYIEIPNTVRRCKDNVLSISGIVLDVDNHMTIEETIDCFDGLEYVLYTTFNHTIDKHKFRVVIPFTRPLLVEDIDKKKQSIIETFPHVDRASFSVSQSFYFHSGLNDNISYHNKGVMIDPYTFADQEVPVYTSSAISYNNNFEISSEYKDFVVKCLMSCKNVRYPSALTLVACCKAINLSFDEFKGIVRQVAANDSSLIKKPECLSGLWQSEYQKITTERRNKFVLDHNGIIPERVLSTNEAIKRLYRK